MEEKVFVLLLIMPILLTSKFFFFLTQEEFQLCRTNLSVPVHPTLQGYTAR